MPAQLPPAWRPVFLALALLCQGLQGADETTSAKATPAIRVNRTVPKVDPPQSKLTFSVSPTAEELSRARVFEEPLVVVGQEPPAAENAPLATALLRYSNRSSQDDFSSLTSYLRKYPKTSWRASLLTNLGIEYYNTAHYSLAIEAWTEAWSLARNATDSRGKALADRAGGELASMYARLGRMTELEAFLASVDGRVFGGPATEKLSGARAGLSNMKERPETAFRCGPLALHRIKLAFDPKNAGSDIIHNSASTQNGFSLPQVAVLTKKLGMDYQMARREKGAAFVVPSVVHWKVGHYAAMIRQEGERFLLQDPTFGNDVWASRETLEAETSGYFLVPAGKLPNGWRAAAAKEAAAVWGKGNTCCNDPKPHGPCDDHTQGGNSCSQSDDECCKGMAVPSVHLMLVSLNIKDEPLGYSPPVGPAVRFKVRYNQREAFQPATFSYANFGPKWTFDWLSYIKDNPFSPSSDVEYYIMGGGTRSFTGYDPTTQAFAYEQYDQTKLTRTAFDRYEMLSRDGSKLVFNQSDGSAGTSRKIFLSQIVDPFGNALSLTYDAVLRLIAITDAIGQVTTLSYEHPSDALKITKVTDPFGRFATFAYDASARLVRITDVIGLFSEFAYDGASDFIKSLTTPYGVTTFTKGESGTTRWLETLFPDGERDRVEYNQTVNIFPFNPFEGADPPASVPVGMPTVNQYLKYRNTYYWSKIACAAGYGDYTKAKVYHWLHTADLASTAGIAESVKDPLGGRIWYGYAGQPAASIVGSSNQPTHIGRVLDDGSTQLHTYEYNGFGLVTKMIDPVGRTFTHTYSTDGVDLLEVRQSRAGNNELLSQTTYNAQHLPLTTKDAAGQTTTYTYNPRGQLLTMSNPRGAVITYHYDTNGYRTSVDGPLSGTGDTPAWAYDAVGRVRTKTDVSGYILTFDYDPLDRLTKITYPDATSDQFTFSRLDRTQIRDRAGRITTFAYNPVGQLTKRTDPLGRSTQFQWCKCGDIKSITDPMGRTTTWRHDIQGRVVAKVYVDGTKVTYTYEKTTNRVRHRSDHQGQVTQYGYYRDDLLREMSYPNAIVATPAIAFTYDPSYPRRTSMSDGTGVTRYEYYPVTGSAALGAGELSAVDGPLPGDTISYAYNETGRRISVAIDGVTSALQLDISGRISSETNPLGQFTYSYDGNSTRLTSCVHPNGQIDEYTYGGLLQDQQLERMVHRVGGTPISEFLYVRELAGRRIGIWSQKSVPGDPFIHTLGYDSADQLISASVSQGGGPVTSFSYSYDLAGNRLNEEIGATTQTATYNALNQLATTVGNAGATVINEWDAEQRLVAVNAGNQRTEFGYDGSGRCVRIRKLVDGLEVSDRRFVWDGSMIAEERTPAGVIVKRFYSQGVRLEAGPAIGSFYYSRDHLGSIRQLTDAQGNVRAEFAYDPFGRRTRLAGDVDADFGFAGMFWASEADLNVTHFRFYHPDTGRWLSRDPLTDAEVKEHWNLYAYVGNDPVNRIDPLGLAAYGNQWTGPVEGCCEKEFKAMTEAIEMAELICEWSGKRAKKICASATHDAAGIAECVTAQWGVEADCRQAYRYANPAILVWLACEGRPCKACDPAPDRRTDYCMRNRPPQSFTF